MESTEFEFRGVVWNGDAVAGDSPETGFGVLWGERSCTHGNVNSVHDLGERELENEEANGIALLC